MVADGVLQADGQPGARGTLYLLLPKWRAILDEPIANHNVGEIKRDQRLLRIKGRPRAIASVIADTGLAAETMWSVRLNGDTDWLLAFDPITSPLMVDRLLAALEQAEVDCARSVAEDVMSGDEFRRYAAAVLDATAQGAGPAKAMRS
jgi:hypothetical protein